MYTEYDMSCAEKQNDLISSSCLEECMHGADRKSVAFTSCRQNSYGAIVDESGQRSGWRRFPKFVAGAAVIVAVIVGIAAAVHTEEAGSSAKKSGTGSVSSSSSHSSWGALSSVPVKAAIIPDPPPSSPPARAPAPAPAALGKPQLAPAAQAVTAVPVNTAAQTQPRTDYLNSDDLAYFPDDVISALNTSMDPCEDFYEVSVSVSVMIGRFIMCSSVCGIVASFPFFFLGIFIRV